MCFVPIFIIISADIYDYFIFIFTLFVESQCGEIILRHDNQGSCSSFPNNFNAKATFFSIAGAGSPNFFLLPSCGFIYYDGSKNRTVITVSLAAMHFPESQGFRYWWMKSNALLTIDDDHEEKSTERIWPATQTHAHLVKMLDLISNKWLVEFECCSLWIILTIASLFLNSFSREGTIHFVEEKRFLTCKTEIMDSSHPQK